MEAATDDPAIPHADGLLEDWIEDANKYGPTTGPAETILDRAGELPETATLEEIRRWLKNVRASLDGASGDVRALVREGAVAHVSRVEAVGSAAKVVDAALNRRSRSDPNDRKDQKQQPEISEDVRRSAMKLLDDPHLLDRAVETMRKRGLVAEGKNARVMFLSGIGGVLDAPIHIVVHGESAGGKNNLARRAFELLPSRYVLSVSGLSEHALEYRGGRIEGVLLVDEAEGQGRAEYGLRVAMSEGRLTRLTVNKGEDGRNRAEELVVEVAASVVTTTTAPALHAENQTRVFDLYVDEGEDVTREVLARRAQEAAGTADIAPEDVLEVWRVGVELLEPAPVTIPWAETLAEGFPTSAVRARRDFPRVLALVEACALLHQRQRPRDDAGRIVATPADWRIVRPLVQEVLGPSMTGLNETAQKLAELHDELVEGQAGPWLRRPDLEEEAGARDIASANTVHKWAKRLTELGVWEGQRKAGRAWEHRRLRDVVEVPIPLPTPEDLTQGVPPLPSPPKTGNGRHSPRSAKGSDEDPNPPNAGRQDAEAKKVLPSDSESGFDWEAAETPSETKERPSHQGDSEGVGGAKASGKKDETISEESLKKALEAEA